jgi:alcohol dehydrogenase
MRVAAIVKQGPAEALQFQEWPQPTIGRGQVLVRVKACGLNHLDLFVRRGMPGVKIDLPRIPGGDIAGFVERVGEGIDSSWEGTRVLLDPHTSEGTLGEHVNGGLCEFVAVDETNLIRIPENVGFSDAAAIPIAYGTAQRMLFSRGALKAGELVLVLGAAGGVGTACVQLASSIGAHVIACASSQQKLDRLRAFGAVDLIDYSREDFARAAWAVSGKRGVDVVVNFTGGDTWVPSLRALRRGGRLVTCGATAGFEPREDLRYIWQRELSILGSHGWARDDLITLLRQTATGALKPCISGELPLIEAEKAMLMIENRENFGKIIIRPDM